MKQEGKPEHKTLRVVLIVVALFVASGAICCVGSWFWLKSKRGDFEAMGERVKAEAAAFATGKSADECVHEALQRTANCDGILCRAEIGVFLKQCLAHSNVPKSFCAGVPKPDDILNGVVWSLARCNALGYPDDENCARTIRKVAEFCAEQKGH